VPVAAMVTAVEAAESVSISWRSGWGGEAARLQTENVSIQQYLMRTSPLTIHPHLHQYLLQQHLLVLLLTLVLDGLPIK
jgi:hypothetical protein